MKFELFRFGELAKADSHRCQVIARNVLSLLKNVLAIKSSVQHQNNQKMVPNVIDSVFLEAEAVGLVWPVNQILDIPSDTIFCVSTYAASVTVLLFGYLFNKGLGLFLGQRAHTLFKLAFRPGCPGHKW